jgi:hypothetical protein
MKIMLVTKGSDACGERRRAREKERPDARERVASLPIMALGGKHRRPLPSTTSTFSDAYRDDEHASLGDS